jgi:hypothetical protein
LVVVGGGAKSEDGAVLMGWQEQVRHGKKTGARVDGLLAGDAVERVFVYMRF